MYFSILCFDKENSLEKRKKLRPDHIQYISKFKEKILLVGPILSELEEPQGSLLIIDFNNRNEANNFSKNDPYYLGGLFKSVEIYKFKKVF